MCHFTGRVAIVTGSTNGIGETVAEILHEQGASVVIASRNKAQSEEKAFFLDSTGVTAFGVECDVSDPFSVQSMVESVMARFGRVDCAVNNAGTTGDHNLCIPEQSLENWDRVISNTLSSVFYCLKYEIPAMLKSGAVPLLTCQQ